MPFIVVESKNDHVSVTRPVAVEIIRQVAEMTNLPESAVQRVIYAGELQQTPLHNSTLSDQPEFKQEAPKLGTDTAIFIEVSEEPVDYTVFSNGIDTDDAPVIFLDETLGIKIRPIYQQHEMSIDVRVRFKSANQANRWRNKILRDRSVMRAENIHTVVYNYHIPPELCIILATIHKYRENVAGYGETLQDYVNPRLHDKVTTLTNQNASQFALAVSETQGRVLGWFDFTIYPEAKQLKEESGTWEIGFNYRIRYDKIFACSMRYPVMVHNQVLDDTISPRELPEHMMSRFVAPGLAGRVFDSIAWPAPYPLQEAGLSIPIFDDWIPNVERKTLSPIFRVLIELNPDDRTDVLDLNNLGSYEIDPVFFNYLKLRPSKLLTYGGTFVYVRLYKGNSPVPDGNLTIDADMHVRSTVPLDLREVHHLYIGFLVDLTEMSNESHDHIRDHAEVALKLLALLDPRIVGTKYMPVPIGNGYIPRKQWIDAVEWIANRYHTNRTHVNYITPLVGQFAIEAVKRNEVDPNAIT